MIYFHKEDQVVCMTKMGVEKLYQIHKTQSRWSRHPRFSIQEVANLSYAREAMVRRYAIDAQSMTQKLMNSWDPLKLLRIRYDITRRGLLLNEYWTTRAEEEKKDMKREYKERNLCDFSNVVIGNFRR